MDFDQQHIEIPMTIKLRSILITSSEMDFGTFQGLNHVYTSHGALIVIVILIVIDKTNDEDSFSYLQLRLTLLAFSS